MVISRSGARPLRSGPLQSGGQIKLVDGGNYRQDVISCLTSVPSPAAHRHIAFDSVACPMTVTGTRQSKCHRLRPRYVWGPEPIDRAGFPATNRHNQLSSTFDAVSQ